MHSHFLRRSICLVLMLILPTHADNQTVLSEEFSPYAYVGVDGQAKGPSIEILSAFVNNGGTTLDLRFLPFQRALLQLDTTPNQLMANYVRTPERERNFAWISLLFCVQPQLYGLPSAPLPSSLRELPRLALQHKFGTIRGSASYRRLLDLGVPASKIDVVDSVEQNLGKLYRGRVTYITGLPHIEQLKTQDNDPNIVAKIALSAPMQFYLIASTQSDQEFLQYWQARANDRAVQEKMRALRIQYGLDHCTENKN